MVNSEKRAAVGEEPGAIEKTVSAPPGEAALEAFQLPDRDTATQKLTAISDFQRLCQRELVGGRDFGVIPGTEKPTLLKPGAEKIAKLLGLADQYEILSAHEDWDRGLFAYRIKCQLSDIASGKVVSEGLGECNSMESRYRWRHAAPRCPVCGQETIIKGKAEYGGGFVCFWKKGGCGARFEENDPAISAQKAGKVENDDIFSQVNTLLKMAKKRALVDAALSAGRLSDLFTQDLEDFSDGGARGETKPAAAPAEGQPAPQRQAVAVGSRAGATAQSRPRPAAAAPAPRTAAGPTQRAAAPRLLN